MQISFGKDTKNQEIEHIPKNSGDPSISVPTSPYFIKKKIQCNVWSTENGIDKVIAQKKVRYGARDFKVSIAGKFHRFRIIYDAKIGALKQGKKFYIYDTHFDNSLGALSFHEYPEKVDSIQAETMLQDGAVRFFIAKGGIPLWWVLIGLIGTVVCAVALAYLAPQYAQLSDIANAQAKQLASNANTIQQLQQQIHSLSGGKS